MTQGTEVLKRECVLKGRNLKRGGAPNSGLPERSDRLVSRRTLRERKLRKGEGARQQTQGEQGETLKRKKAKRGANVRSG